MEVSINYLADYYSNGKIKQFKYIEKGYWIVAELKPEVLETDELKNVVAEEISNNRITNKLDFRLMAKVIGLDEFKQILVEKTGTSPDIPIVKSSDN